jgi:hypothetical protein
MLKAHVLRMSFLMAIMLLGIAFQAQAQIPEEETLGNWRVKKNSLVWQKSYPLVDKEELNERLKANDFTSGLDILGFITDVETKPYTLNGYNLPEYAQHEYTAFLFIDFFPGEYRVTLQQINFPDFEEKIYWNGMRQHDARGTLEKYILGNDGRIKRNSANLRVLETFDTAFSGVFDPMADVWSE